MQNVFSQDFPARARFETDTSSVNNVYRIWKKAFEFHADASRWFDSQSVH
jgi:hypothetical protein